MKNSTVFISLPEKSAATVSGLVRRERYFAPLWDLTTARTGSNKQNRNRAVVKTVTKRKKNRAADNGCPVDFIIRLTGKIILS